MNENWHFTQSSRWASDAADAEKRGHHDVAERYRVQAYKHWYRALELKEKQTGAATEIAE